MNPILQKVYWRAPYFMKRWIVSANSRKLDHQRFGPAYQQIIEEIAGREKWSFDQFREYQKKELCSLIQHVAVNVPYFRRMFQKINIDPKSIKEPEDLKRLPILDKEVVRANEAEMVDESLDASKLIINSTSGTTGMPLELYRDIWLNSAAFAYLDARWHSIIGVRRRLNKSVSVGGHLVADPGRTKPPFWLYNRRWNQLYMSSYHLSPRYLGYYVEELRRFKADYIEGYPSSVYAIAKYIVDNNIKPIEFKGCFTTAETLFDYHREAIKKAFGCCTYNQYGCGEMAVFAAECSAGAMHLSPEFGIVEVVDDNDQPVSVGQTGHLICTSLINRVQPFIRYRIGDIGALKDGGCSCGSSLPVLDRIEGRMGSMLITRDGRKIGAPGLTLLFHHVKGVAETQIVQEDYDLFRVRLVPVEGYEDTEGQKIVANLAECLGDVEIRLELIDKVERTKSGKFVAVVCNLTKDEK